MNTIQVIGAGLLYLLILLSGKWLSRSGKPRNGILLTLHKLISLAALALFILTLYRINRVTALGPAGWVAAGVSVLFYLGAIATGGLLSVDRPMPAAVLTIHRITPFLTVLFAGVALYLLLAQ